MELTNSKFFEDNNDGKNNHKQKKRIFLKSQISNIFIPFVRINQENNEK